MGVQRRTGTSDEPERKYALGTLLVGKKVYALEPGWEAEDAFVLLRCRDESGAIAWAYRTTSAMNREELLGALSVQTELLRRELVEEWEPSDIEGE